MSLEDASVLAKLFSHLAREDQIQGFLYAFQDLRQQRCKEIRAMDMANIHFETMPESEQATERDRTMRAKFERGEDVLVGADDQNVLRWDKIRDVFGYDAEDEADNWWVQWGRLREQANAHAAGTDSVGINIAQLGR